MPIATPVKNSAGAPDDVDYHYDEDGMVTAVEVSGETFELSDAQSQRFPGKNRLPDTVSTQTSIRSTIEDIKASYSDYLTMDDQQGGDSILVDIEATHGGYFNDNQYYYKFSGMQEMVGTWTANGGRPYLVNHDKQSKPRGRVVGARAVKTADSNARGETMGFHVLDVRVGDPEEIEMIVDGRALHVSVGSRPVDTVECNVCRHDLYHDGRGASRYTLSEEPAQEVLQQDAPGVFGEMGLTYEDFFKIEESDGNWTAHCRHVRGHDCPVGGDQTRSTGWMMHANKYREVSRVNEPADVNEATGEYAHIRGLKEQEDSLQGDALDKVVEDELARVPGPTDHARHSIASEKDLWRPRTASKAKEHAQESGFDDMFDTALWSGINASNPQMTTADKVESYWKQGGRFFSPPNMTDTNTSPTANAAEQHRADLNAEDSHPDAKYSQGDKVKWSWSGSTVHGRVAASGDSFTVEGNEITGEEDEPVYKLDEYDQDAEEFKEGNVAKPESSLSKSDMDMETSDSITDQEYEVGEETIEIYPPDYMQSAAQAYLDASDENMVPDDCGTGVGADRASQIVNDEVGPDVVAEIASYLTSHEEDLTADGNPSGWGEEEWDDCGNAQYAAWGGGGSGDAKSWAQDKANEVAEARGEEMPYEDRLSFAQALKLNDARAFGNWLRSSDHEGEEAEMIDQLYTSLYLQRMEDDGPEDAKGDWEAAGSEDLDTTGSMDNEWNGSDALDELMSAAEGEDGEISDSMVRRGVAAFDSSSDGQNKEDYKGQFATVQDGEVVADMAGIDSLNRMAEQMDVPESVIEETKSLVASYMPDEEQEDAKSEDCGCTDSLTADEALKLDDPAEFGDWLREQTDLSAKKKRMLDREYTKLWLERR
jgi:hypothetical protein